MKKVEFWGYSWKWLCLMVLLGSVSGQEYFAPSGVAINGYDPVAYITQQKAKQGEKKYGLEWRGVEWYFVSEKNKKLFSEDPERYAPQYGGYCAYGMANNYTAKTEPEAFTIKDGKLYLNYNLGVRSSWLKRKNQYIIDGNKNWRIIRERLRKSENSRENSRN